MEIISIHYKSTNCYLISTGEGLLAFDAGWPNTYTLYKDALGAEGYKMKQIKWLMVSHFHMDHAGLAGVFMHNGVQFLVFENQVDSISDMEKLIESKGKGYLSIDTANILKLTTAESRNWLSGIGIQGEVLPTTGHSTDSVSLLLDGGEVFSGDLAPEFALAEEDECSRENWKMLRSSGARQVFPAHGPAWEL